MGGTLISGCVLFQWLLEIRYHTSLPIYFLSLLNTLDWGYWWIEGLLSYCVRWQYHSHWVFTGISSSFQNHPGSVSHPLGIRSKLTNSPSFNVYYRHYRRSEGCCGGTRIERSTITCRLFNSLWGLRGNRCDQFCRMFPFHSEDEAYGKFVCHHNTIFIYKSLSTPTLDRFYAVTHVSTAMSLFCCLLMAVSGYVVFTSKTEVSPAFVSALYGKELTSRETFWTISHLMI